MKVVHIVNPVKVPESSDLFLAQPVTFASMQKAKAKLSSNHQVTLVAACYEEDMVTAPDFMDKKFNLERSVLDCGDFLKRRKLPLIGDIISSASDLEYDYLIYTNVDIALMPWFYERLVDRINEGYDSFIINRRTLTTDYTEPKDLDKMYSQAGQVHPGLDCFVMSKDVVQKLVLSEVCIGVTFIGKVLEANCLTHSSKFKVFKHEHMTFHLGDDKVWENPDLQDYREHNKKHMKAALLKLLPMAIEKGRSEAIKKIKLHLYKHCAWNDDGQNPFLKPIQKKTKPPVSVRIKRAIGALMGNT